MSKKIIIKPTMKKRRYLIKSIYFNELLIIRLGSTRLRLRSFSGIYIPHYLPKIDLMQMNNKICAVVYAQKMDHQNFKARESSREIPQHPKESVEESLRRRNFIRNAS